MIKNLYSLGLLRNGKVYPSKQHAVQGLTQTATNDGVANLARYLITLGNGKKGIRTIVGFYANADEMEDNGSDESTCTILDVEGNASGIEALSGAISTINETIGDGLDL